jgi:hypothetical protein
MELEGLEVYNSFRKGAEDEKEKDPPRFQDIHM